MKRIPQTLRALPIAFLTLVTTASAQPLPVMGSPDLATFDYGILCYYGDATTPAPYSYDEVHAISHDAGYFAAISVQRTVEIPAVEGIVFGLATALPEGVSHEVQAVVIHTDPDGTVSEREETLLLSDELTTDMWSLSHAPRSAQGTYRFLGLTPSQMFYDLTFTVVPAADYSGPYPDCVEGR